MTQRTLDGKSDCKGVKGTIHVKMSPAFKEEHPEICDALKECHKKYPCVKIRVNKKKLEEKPIVWDKPEKI